MAEFTPTEARDLLMALVGASEDGVVKDILKSAVLAKAAAGNMQHSDRLTPDEVIRDLFTARERHVVPTPGTIEIGPTVAAAGEGAEGMLKHYSRFAPQPQALTKEYDKFSEEFGSLRAYLKSLQETTQTQMEAMVKALEALTKAKKGEEEEEGGINIAVEEEEEEEEKSKSFKSLRAELLNTMISKAEEEEEEGGDEEEEEEMGKALSPTFRVMLAKATLRATKDFCAKTDLSKTARGNLKTIVAKSLRRAKALAKATVDDKTLTKAATEALRAVEEYMFLRGVQAKAKPVEKKEGMETEGNQKKWPNEDSAKSFDTMLAGLEKTQTDIKGLFDMLAHKSKSTSVMETVEPLAKAMASPNFLIDKERFVEDQAKARKINDSEYGAAQEILGAMRMFKAGQISKDVPAQMIQGASRNVKDLFRDVVVEA